MGLAFRLHKVRGALTKARDWAFAAGRGLWGLGFRFIGIRVLRLSLGFGVEGSGFRVGAYRVWGLGVPAKGSRRQLSVLFLNRL